MVLYGCIGSDKNITFFSQMGNVCSGGKGKGLGPINKFCKCGGPRPHSGGSHKGRRGSHGRKGSPPGHGRRRKGSHSS